MLKVKSNSSITSRIRRLLKAYIGSKMPTLDETAAQIAISPQSLRRKLAAEGNSYQVIKDELRRDVAIDLMAAQVSLNEVSQWVGFSESSTFYRAFKKWTGVPPGAYRQAWLKAI